MRALNRMRVLGLMSGTSVDAIDAAVVDLGEDGSLRVVDHRELAWDEELRRRILAVLPPATVEVAEVCALEQLIGQAFAAAASEVMAQVDGVELVSCHGQTVFHWVDRGRALGTLQWGEPAWIAEATGLPVVSHLRAADIAAGGQGAPLVPVLDAWLFADRPTAVVNLGGIANVTLVDDGVALAAGDTGPANCLLDAVVSRATDGREGFDRDGRYSAGGAIIPDLLAALLRHPYLALPLPKSTGREVFSLDWLDSVVASLPGDASSPPLADLLATLVEFTAVTLLAHLEPTTPGPGLPAATTIERVVVSGGGAHHPGLMARLRRDHPEWEVVPPEVAGIPGDAKEAVLVALLGWLSVSGRAGIAVDGHGHALTGAHTPRVLGTLTLHGSAGWFGLSGAGSRPRPAGGPRPTGDPPTVDDASGRPTPTPAR
ncbi:anhydro-N-acetylmuramic acid kinase [Aestuariimicrobium kwangyangense]|uniref:anhydro-N-acetylmuramic acid kinase n=1 Tax=Aestuariimicrobium kwangyangense TaxID=396389 RepID=UPI0012FC636B|nr:anhydro-N-acetylmuramic acid kinase [Aestuariimicrobium kwangyangense]